MRFAEGMKRSELNAALQAAGKTAQETDFLLIGSQAVHAYCRRPPAEVLLSQECDIYPVNRPEASELLHAHLGRGSDYARQNGFYVDVVTPDLAGLPEGWKSRLHRFRAGPVTAWCLEVHDLVVSKLAAGRLKDLEFVAALFLRTLADPRTVLRRIDRYPIARDRRHLRSRLRSVLDDLGWRPAEEG